MKKTKLLMTAPLAIAAATAPVLATSCNLFNPQPTAQTLSRIDLTNAAAVFTNSGESSSDTTMNVITKSGSLTSLTGMTAQGNSVTLKGDLVRKIDEQWAVMRLTGDYYGSYLINIQSSLCYKFSDFSFGWNRNRPNSAIYQKDVDGNLYFINSSKIKKTKIIDPNNLTVTDVTYTDDSISDDTKFGVSGSGELAYLQYKDGEKIIRFRKTDGEWKHLTPETNESFTNIWQGNDKNIYVCAHISGTGTKIYSIGKDASGDPKLIEHDSTSSYYYVENEDVYHMSNSVIYHNNGGKEIYHLTPNLSSYSLQKQYNDGTDYVVDNKLYMGTLDGKIDVYYSTASMDTINVNNYDVKKIRATSSGLIMFFAINSNNQYKMCTCTSSEDVKPFEPIFGKNVDYFEVI